MKWRLGDLGRFRAEDPARPRFEVLGAKRGQHVEVWYGGSTRSTLIPWDTFLQDCVNWWRWNLTVSIPDWLKPGAIIILTKHTHVLQAEIKRKASAPHRLQGPQMHFVDVRGDLQVRSVRHDYASCLVKPRGPLAMVPVQQIADHGYRPLTAWDKLRQDGDMFEVEDDLSDLFD